MKYVALLRAINVGGNALIKMADLKKAFDEEGYTNILTYIQSGNVIFESESTNSKKIEDNLEKALSKRFQYSSKVVVLSEIQFRQVLADIPKRWQKEQDLRCYIAFVKTPALPKDVLREATLTEGIDFLDEGKKVVYMTTLMRGLMNSGFKKLIGKNIYKEMTMRNYSTRQKILQLL